MTGLLKSLPSIVWAEIFNSVVSPNEEKVTVDELRDSELRDGPVPSSQAAIRTTTSRKLSSHKSRVIFIGLLSGSIGLWLLVYL